MNNSNPEFNTLATGEPLSDGDQVNVLTIGGNRRPGTFRHSPPRIEWPGGRVTPIGSTQYLYPCKMAPKIDVGDRVRVSGALKPLEGLNGQEGTVEKIISLGVWVRFGENNSLIRMECLKKVEPATHSATFKVGDRVKHQTLFQGKTGIIMAFAQKLGADIAWVSFNKTGNYPAQLKDLEHE